MKLSGEDFDNFKPGDSVVFEDDNVIYEGDELVFDGIKARLFKVTGIAYNDGKVYVTFCTSSMSIGVVCWDDKLKVVVGFGARWFFEKSLSTYLKMLQSDKIRVIKKTVQREGE